MLGRRAASDWLKSWPEPYRVLVLADAFDGEVGNGGIHQYFRNDSGDLASETVAAMRALGLPRTADLVARGMGFFPTPYPSDQKRREAAFAREAFEAWDARFATLGDLAGVEAVRPAMVGYAKREGLLPR